jgi:hypothetical protein
MREQFMCTFLRIAEDFCEKYVDDKRGNELQTASNILAEINFRLKQAGITRSDYKQRARSFVGRVWNEVLIRCPGCRRLH